MIGNTLQERSVLMLFRQGSPGTRRTDKVTTAEVKAEKHLGDESGDWVQRLFPKDAFAAIKKIQNEAYTYHSKVTFPFGGPTDDEKGDDDKGDKASPALSGVGILPAVLILEYGDKMKDFRDRMGVEIEKFLEDPKRWIDWAIAKHNGTFNPDNYPGCERLSSGEVVLDEERFKSVMRKKFVLHTEPLPVPLSEHFTAAITGLLGVDVESVNLRVRDASLEAQRELLRRMIAPVKAMAEKLVEQPKAGREDIVFRDSLIGNIQAMAELVPKMNLSGDQQIDAFAKEMEALTRYSPDVLREDKATRSEAAAKAKEIFDRLTSYSL